MKSDGVGGLFGFIKALLKLEFKTDAGRFNFGGSLILLGFAGLLAITGEAAEIVRVIVSAFRPQVAETGISWGGIFITFAVLIIVCVAMIALYEWLIRRNPD